MAKNLHMSKKCTTFAAKFRIAGLLKTDNK